MVDISKEESIEASLEEKDLIKDNNPNSTSETKPHYSRHLFNKAKTTLQKQNYSQIGKSIKSGASSFTNDSC